MKKYEKMENLDWKRRQGRVIKSCSSWTIQNDDSTFEAAAHDQHLQGNLKW